MKRTVFIFLTFFFFGKSQSQTPLDSLMLMAESEIAADTATIDSINEYVYEHYRTYPELVDRIIQKVLTQAKNIGYKQGQAKSYRRLGTVAYVQGKTKELIDSQFKAMAIYESLGDSLGVAYCWNNIGLAYLQIDEYNKAKKMFMPAVNSAIHSDLYFTAICYNNLGIVHEYLGNPDSALFYVNKAVDIRLEFFPEKKRLQANYTNLGVLYFKHFSNYAKAIDLIQKSLDINLENRNFVGLAGNYIHLGDIYKAKNQSHLAMQNYLLAIKYADSSKNNNTLGMAYLQASDLEAFRGNIISSQEYFKKYHEADKKATEDKQKVEIKRLENSYTILQKEKELVKLKAEKAQQDLIKAKLISGILAIVIVLVSVIFYTIFRIRKAIRKRRKLEEALDAKNKELTSYALNFIQKNELLQELSEIVNSSENGIASLEVQRINRIISNNLQVDRDWENFKMMFEEVHKNFFASLKEKYPAIGSSELKLCALTKLNFNLKETSKILGISPESVKTARHRLRKKLGLSRDENLTDFLIRIDTMIAA